MPPPRVSIDYASHIPGLPASNGSAQNFQQHKRRRTSNATIKQIRQPAFANKERLFSTLQGGKVSARAVLDAVGAHREEFEFNKHCEGLNMTATPDDIVARIERYSGLQLRTAFAIPDLDKEIKRHCKYARQNGIHV